MSAFLIAIPLVPLAVLAMYLGGRGVSALWLLETRSVAEPAVAYAIAASIHLAWILPVVHRRRHTAVSAAWVCAVWLSADGLTDAGFETGADAYALLLEAIVLAIARGYGPVLTWPERLAGWRRTRERVMTELRIGDGILPWFGSAVTRLVNGRADRPLCSSFERIVAELADTGDRMRRTIASLALPEAARDFLESATQAIVADAETTAAKLAIDLEHRALNHAATCRDAILALEDLPDPHRDRLARECESLILDLAHNVGATAGRWR